MFSGHLFVPIWTLFSKKCPYWDKILSRGHYCFYSVMEQSKCINSGIGTVCVNGPQKPIWQNWSLHFRVVLYAIDMPRDWKLQYIWSVDYKNRLTSRGLSSLSELRSESEVKETCTLSCLIVFLRLVYRRT